MVVLMRQQLGRTSSWSARKGVALPSLETKRQDLSPAHKSTEHYAPTAYGAGSCEEQGADCPFTKQRTYDAELTCRMPLKLTLTEYKIKRTLKTRQGNKPTDDEPTTKTKANARLVVHKTSSSAEIQSDWRNTSVHTRNTMQTRRYLKLCCCCNAKVTTLLLLRRLIVTLITDC
jgi:hypothetical protein